MKTYQESEALSHSDTEITLGVRSILGIFFGLVLVCGVFFGFGYSLGRGNTEKPASSAQMPSHSIGTSPSPEVKTVVENSASSGTNPSADDQYTYVPGPGGPTRKPAGVTLPTKPSAASVAGPAPIDAVKPASVEVDTSAVPVAVPATNGPAQAKAVSAAYPIQTAAPISSIMVQIAAVSRREDADVLVSALKKLGYSASVRGETTDNLLHVQVGPFATRDEAKTMRAKLLNDGYNAILK